MSNTGSNLDRLRRGNLAAVLRIVHRAQQVSRAQITASTGLYRSTVGALVTELESLGLVIEGEPEATNRVGRPSPVVRPAPEVVALAVNPEVDAITVGVVGLGARVEHRVRLPVSSPATVERTVGLVAELMSAGDSGPLEGRRVVGVGVAVPGLVRAADGLVRWAPHLGWRDVPIAALLEEAVGVPAAADNDASLGALAEHLFGVGQGVDDLVYVNGGPSGIGGGVIAGGRPLRGAGGYAGEIGHNRPGVRGSEDRLSDSGALEDEVSRARLLAVLGLTEADEPTLARALLSSRDDAVRGELDRQRAILGTALSNAANVLNPSLIVLGGFLATILASDPERLAALVASQTLPPAAEDLRLDAAALAEDRLLIGAAELVFAPLLADPAAGPRR
ncbi:ROK family protein [Naasia aerilata]|uniref:Sugar kinase n=1 Tax=Naasia aerilata TaxID=1162966 RepID=A0ABM8GBV7_9MICO|nr:ROK family protein [Naasia aerilata]BDZ45721.1 sugar kinase [Naasia aerilata]